MVKTISRFCHVVLLFAAVALAQGCGHKTLPSTAAYSRHETECLGSDPDGHQRLRVWGSGRDASAAREDARKKAVEAVVFGNIVSGSGNCNSWPVIDSPAARRVHSEFFAKFFKNGGKYKKFVKAEKPDKSERLEGNDMVVQPMEITVDRAGLVRYFTKEHILQ